MVPPAPGLFSMMTGWPSLADSSLDTARPITSVALPGVKATMMWIGFSGQVWACAEVPAKPRAAIAAIKRRMVSPVCSSFGGNLPADAGDVQAPQNAFTRGGELGPDRGNVGAQQLAVALGEAAGDQHVAHPGAAALHDHGGHRI